MGDKITKYYIQEYEKKGWVKKKRHKTLPLTIYNYTREVMYRQLRDGNIHRVRALVLDDDYNVVARWMERPFNMWYYESLPDREYYCYEKYDGSLVLLFTYEWEKIVCTKGSFYSEQSKVAREILWDDIPDIEDDSTYLFEVIYPENKIVVDYWKEKTLKFLGIVDNAWGYMTPAQTEFMGFDYPQPDVYTLDELIEYQQQPYENDEGFIVRGWQLFFKVKKNAYVDIHKTVSWLSTWHIWKMLKDWEEINLEQFPDETYTFIENTIKQLRNKYKYHSSMADGLYKEVKVLPSRKEQALAVKDSKYSWYIFAKLDGKPIEEHVRNMCEPEDKTDRISSL